MLDTDKSFYFILFVIIFVILNRIFLKFPLLIHKKKNADFSLVHISHRGGAGEETENTLEAFNNAYRLRSDMFETDVHLTKDEQIVAIHDESLDRLFGKDLCISNLNYDDLPEFTTPIPLSFPSNQFKTSVLNEFPKKVLLLEDLFKKFPDSYINIDVKIDNDILIDKLDALIRKYNREDKIIWGSFRHAIYKKLVKKNPNIDTFCSSFDAMRTIGLFMFGLLPYFSLGFTYYEFPLLSIIKSKSCNLVPFGTGRFKNFRDAMIKKFAYSSSMFEHLNKRGISVLMWVGNSEEQFEEAFEYRANGIMTDFPLKLGAYLNKRPNLCNQKTYISKMI